MFCTLCKTPFYCGKECQKKDWELGHKIACKKLRKAQENEKEKNAATTKNDKKSDAAVDGVDSANGHSDDLQHAVLPLPNRWLYPPSSLTSLWSAAPDFPSPPIGFLNPKTFNSCFFNVVLQCILATRPLMAWFDSDGHEADRCVVSCAGKFCSLCRLISLRQQVLAKSREAQAAAKLTHGGMPLHPSLKSLLPKDMLQNLSKLNPEFQLGAQEDAHDTLMTLLHHMDECWMKNEKQRIRNAQEASQLSQTTASDDSSASNADIVAPIPSKAAPSNSPSPSSSSAPVPSPSPSLPIHLSHRTLETSPISQLFGGYLLSTRECASRSCGKLSESFEFFMDLSLEIIAETDRLEEMVEAFCRPERFDSANLYKCAHCNVKSKAIKQITIHHQPSVLLLNLKRFRHGVFGKVNKRITFPLKFSLEKYMTRWKREQDEKEFEQQQRAKKNDNTDSNGNVAPISDTPLTSPSAPYSLYGVIVHLDLMNVASFGHYITYIRHPDPQLAAKDVFLRYDDDEVTMVKSEEVLKQTAYLLLYQRDEPVVPKDEVQQEGANDAANGSTLPSSSPSLSPSSSTSSTASSSSSSDPAPIQCVGGCGFWAKTGVNGNMCSKCWRESQPESEQEQKLKAESSSTNHVNGTKSTMDPRDMLRLMQQRAIVQQRIQQQQQQQQQDSTSGSSAVDRHKQEMAQLMLAQKLRQLEGLSGHAPAQQRTLQPQPSAQQQQPAAQPVKVGRNDDCPCGSGKKYKKCHGK